MWQVAVAAAVAGSGLLAKHLFNPIPDTIKKQECDEQKQTQQSQLQVPIDHTEDHSHTTSIRPICEQEKGNADGGIFRFSSSGSRSKSRKSRVLVQKKNLGGVIRRRKILGRFDTAGSGGKRVSVCLKRRRTSRVSSGKPDSSCSEGCSSFGWGLGLGMMYMMSAGKTEVSKLNSAIDETAKVVHELKAKLSSHCPQLLEDIHDVTNTMDSKQKINTEQVTTKQCTLNKSPTEAKRTNHLAESEYASSVLTEEQHNEGTEMGQLEAELESELQKLPWCTAEASAYEGNINNSSQFERGQSKNQSLTAYQSGGISPAELKNKLSHLLIEQQEGHILELESELNLAYSKLQEKEDELRALKDCVRRLTEFSLSTISDEETEAHREQEQILKQDPKENMRPPTTTLGTKRAMDFGTV